MLTCIFEDGDKASFRHVVTHALIEKDECLLLGKRAEGIKQSGKWGLPGGFVDRDETVTQGMLREIREETGWIGEVVSLFRINSNPDRHDDGRQNVAFEFIVRPIKQVGSKDAESSKVEWIPIAKLLPFSNFAFDHGETIRLYLKYRQEHFPLPIVV